MTLLELDTRKQELMIEVNKLVLLKKKLYSNVDNESPMSKEEKELNSKISLIYSQINHINKEKRNLKMKASL